MYKHTTHISRLVTVATWKFPDVRDYDAASCASSPFSASCVPFRLRGAFVSCVFSREYRDLDLQEILDQISRMRSVEKLYL